MRSLLELHQSRLRLLQELKRRGLYARWHAYEYLLGYKGEIVGVLLLEPSRLRATLYLRRGAAGEVAEIVGEALRAVDQAVELEVRGA